MKPKKKWGPRQLLRKVLEVFDAEVENEWDLERGRTVTVVCENPDDHLLRAIAYKYWNRDDVVWLHANDPALLDEYVDQDLLSTSHVIFVGPRCANRFVDMEVTGQAAGIFRGHHRAVAIWDMDRLRDNWTSKGIALELVRKLANEADIWDFLSRTCYCGRSMHAYDDEGVPWCKKHLPLR